MFNNIILHLQSCFHGPTFFLFFLQEAVAVCFQREYDTFGTEESYLRQQLTQFQAKRLRLMECLRSFGLQTFAPDGGYYIIADISTLSESSYQCILILIHCAGVKYFYLQERKTSYLRQMI